jgi:hypothetical protein
MNCTELGFDDEGNLRVSKSVDLEDALVLPSSYDLSDYEGEFQIRASEDAASALLTVTTTATAEGSVIIFDGESATLRLKLADLSTLPENADDSDDPWVGVYEWVVTDPDGLVSRFCIGSLIAERGVVR